MSKNDPVGFGLLGVHVTSFTFVPMAITAVNSGGLALVFGMVLAVFLVEIIISRLIKETKKLFPPVVNGIVVMLIGLGLMETGITNFG